MFMKKEKLSISHGTKRVRNAMNYTHSEIKNERFTKPSMTVPDMTLTVREIFNRFARGAVLPVKDIYYDETEDMPDIRTLDLAEQEVYQKIAEEEILRIRSPKNKDHEEETENVSGKPQGKDEDQSLGDTK